MLPNTYWQLEYIESTGTQYIDTGIIANEMSSLKYELDFQMTTTSQSNYSSMGCGSWGSSGWYGNIVSFGNYHSGIICRINTTGDTKLADKDTNRHKLIIDCDNSVAIFDDVSTSITIDSTSATGHLLLFASASLSGTTPYSSTYCKCRLYSFKVGVIRNFIPAMRKSDNVVGLYDDVNDVFYTNNGSGTFVTGGIVDGPLNITFTDNPLAFKAGDDVSFIANFKRTANCRFKVNGEWKMAMMYKKINGEWVTGPTRVKVSGTWKDGS